MAFKKECLNEIFGTVLVLTALLSTAPALDCQGKSFHCVNSTHFLICVDLGGGVSQSIDNFLIPCPPPTVCQGSNHFECEFPASTPLPTPSDAVSDTTRPWEERVTTSTPQQNPAKEHYENHITTESLMDRFTTDATVDYTTEGASSSLIYLNSQTNETEAASAITELIFYDTTTVPAITESVFYETATAMEQVTQILPENAITDDTETTTDIPHTSLAESKTNYVITENMPTATVSSSNSITKENSKTINTASGDVEGYVRTNKLDMDLMTGVASSSSLIDLNSQTNEAEAASATTEPIFYDTTIVPAITESVFYETATGMEEVTQILSENAITDNTETTTDIPHTSVAVSKTNYIITENMPTATVSSSNSITKENSKTINTVSGDVEGYVRTNKLDMDLMTGVAEVSEKGSGYTTEVNILTSDNFDFTAHVVENFDNTIMSEYTTTDATIDVKNRDPPRKSTLEGKVTTDITVNLATEQPVLINTDALQNELTPVVDALFQYESVTKNNDEVASTTDGFNFETSIATEQSGLATMDNTQKSIEEIIKIQKEAPTTAKTEFINDKIEERRTNFYVPLGKNGTTSDANITFNSTAMQTNVSTESSTSFLKSVQKNKITPIHTSTISTINDLVKTAEMNTTETQLTATKEQVKSILPYKKQFNNDPSSSPENVTYNTQKATKQIIKDEEESYITKIEFDGNIGRGGLETTIDITLKDYTTTPSTTFDASVTETTEQPTPATFANSFQTVENQLNQTDTPLISATNDPSGVKKTPIENNVVMRVTELNIENTTQMALNQNSKVEATVGLSPQISVIGYIKNISVEQTTKQIENSENTDNLPKKTFISTSEPSNATVQTPITTEQPATVTFEDTYQTIFDDNHITELPTISKTNYRLPQQLTSDTEITAMPTDISLDDKNDTVPIINETEGILTFQKELLSTTDINNEIPEITTFNRDIVAKTDHDLRNNKSVTSSTKYIQVEGATEGKRNLTSSEIITYLKESPAIKEVRVNTELENVNTPYRSVTTMATSVTTYDKIEQNIPIIIISSNDGNEENNVTDVLKNQEVNVTTYSPLKVNEKSASFNQNLIDPDANEERKVLFKDTGIANPIFVISLAPSLIERSDGKENVLPNGESDIKNSAVIKQQIVGSNLTVNETRERGKIVTDYKTDSSTKFTKSKLENQDINMNKITTMKSNKLEQSNNTILQDISENKLTVRTAMNQIKNPESVSVTTTTENLAPMIENYLSKAHLSSTTENTQVIIDELPDLISSVTQDMPNESDDLQIEKINTDKVQLVGLSPKNTQYAHSFSTNKPVVFLDNVHESHQYLNKVTHPGNLRPNTVQNVADDASISTSILTGDTKSRSNSEFEISDTNIIIQQSETATEYTDTKWSNVPTSIEITINTDSVTSNPLADIVFNLFNKGSEPDRQPLDVFEQTNLSSNEPVAIVSPSVVVTQTIATENDSTDISNSTVSSMTPTDSKTKFIMLEDLQNDQAIGNFSNTVSENSTSTTSNRVQTETDIDISTKSTTRNTVLKTEGVTSFVRPSINIIDVPTTARSTTKEIDLNIQWAPADVQNKNHDIEYNIKQEPIYIDMVTTSVNISKPQMSPDDYKTIEVQNMTVISNKISSTADKTDESNLHTIYNNKVNQNKTSTESYKPVIPDTIVSSTIDDKGGLFKKSRVTNVILKVEESSLSGPIETTRKYATGSTSQPQIENLFISGSEKMLQNINDTHFIEHVLTSENISLNKISIAATPTQSIKLTETPNILKPTAITSSQSINSISADKSNDDLPKTVSESVQYMEIFTRENYSLVNKTTKETGFKNESQIRVTNGTLLLPNVNQQSELTIEQNVSLNNTEKGNDVNHLKSMYETVRSRTNTAKAHKAIYQNNTSNLTSTNTRYPINGSTATEYTNLSQSGTSNDSTLILSENTVKGSTENNDSKLQLNASVNITEPSKQPFPLKSNTQAFTKRITPKTISTTIEKPKKRVANNSTSNYTCINGVRGRYSDKDDCRKFYICIGNTVPIVGHCPVNTVFSDVKKLCTKNMSHCIRENEFKCPSGGRFSDFGKENVYYICVSHNNHFYRFKFQCQKGFTLNKTTVRCVEDKEIESSESVSIASTDNDSDTSHKLGIYISTSTSSSGSSISSKSSKSSSSSMSSTSGDSDSKSSKRKINKEKSEGKEEDEDKKIFECEKEGKFPVHNNCRRYYLCKKNRKSQFRRKLKKCKSGDVFNRNKKKCVDGDSYEC